MRRLQSPLLEPEKLCPPQCVLALSPLPYGHLRVLGGSALSPASVTEGEGCSAGQVA